MRLAAILLAISFPCAFPQSDFASRYGPKVGAPAPAIRARVAAYRFAGHLAASRYTNGRQMPAVRVSQSVGQRATVFVAPLIVLSSV